MECLPNNFDNTRKLSVSAYKFRMCFPDLYTCPDPMRQLATIAVETQNSGQDATPNHCCNHRLFNRSLPLTEFPHKL